MLYADKRALETNLKVSLLQIREKELNFYSQNCLAVGTQAALLAGFAYAGLTQVAVPEEAYLAVKLLYLIATTTAMGFELVAVLNTTLLSMLGPGLALRGPDGSMHVAVDGMMVEYKLAFYFFLLGLISFHFSAMLFGWLMFSNFVASTLTTSIVISLWSLYRYSSGIMTKFQLPADLVETGRFEDTRNTRNDEPGPSDYHQQEADSNGSAPSRRTSEVMLIGKEQGLEESSGEGNNSDDYVCDECAVDGIRSEAWFHCSQCDQFLCERCNTSIHSRGRRALHQVESLFEDDGQDEIQEASSSDGWGVMSSMARAFNAK